MSLILLDNSSFPVKPVFYYGNTAFYYGNTAPYFRVLLTL